MIFYADTYVGFLCFEWSPLAMQRGESSRDLFGNMFLRPFGAAAFHLFHQEIKQN